MVKVLLSRYLYCASIGFALMSSFTSVRAMEDPVIGRWLTRDPIGYKGGPNLYQFLGSRPTGLSDPTGLYEKDVHFYMTYYLAAACGLEPAVWTGATVQHDPFYDWLGGYLSDAYMIAWADQEVDVDERTTPDPLKNIYAFSDPLRFRVGLSQWHFRVSAPGGVVVADSPVARQPALQGIATGNRMLFGIGLHALQDSYSHAGYTWAHWPDHSVDWPFTNVNKAMEMAKNTYGLLDQWKRRNYSNGECPQGCRDSFSMITPTLIQMFTFQETDEDIRALGWRLATFRDYGVDGIFAGYGMAEWDWGDDFIQSALLVGQTWY